MDKIQSLWDAVRNYSTGIAGALKHNRPNALPASALGELSDLVKSYEYGQFNILDNGMKISYNPEERQVELSPFYHFGDSPTMGSCSELMTTAYSEIRKRHPDYYVIRAAGHDPDFFTRQKSNHCYLLVSHEDLMKGKPHTREQADIKEVTSKNPIVVDPSFHRVVRFSDSGYIATVLHNQGCKVLYSNALVLPHGEGVPLGISSKGELVNLYANLDSPQVIDIAIMEPGKSALPYRLDSEELYRKFAGDAKILRFIDLLRKREKTEVYRKFDAESNGIIID